METSADAAIWDAESGCSDLTGTVILKEGKGTLAAEREPGLRSEGVQGKTDPLLARQPTMVESV